MPAKSAAQFRFMKGVEGGSIKKKGLSKDKAKEFTAGQSPKGLPNKVGSKAPAKTNPMMAARRRNKIGKGSDAAEDMKMSASALKADIKQDKATLKQKK